MATILVVDDDQDVLEAIRICLEKEGHKVLTAQNRADGMTGVKSARPDMLILDCMMEEADDGMVMAQELRKSGFTAPILMLSNISNITGMNYGSDREIIPVEEFVTKPIDSKNLVAKVNELLTGKK